MIRIELTTKEQVILTNLVQTTDSVKTYRRAQALLWLHEGWTTQSVAEQFRVTRQTIWNWMNRFLQRRSLSINQWVDDQPRTGRPKKVNEQVESLLDDMIDDDPQDWGYQYTTWTADLLAQCLEECYEIQVTGKTVRRALDRLGISWKRPRYVLANRSPTWRQAKGG